LFSLLPRCSSLRGSSWCRRNSMGTCTAAARTSECDLAIPLVRCHEGARSRH
jgi:hypothetical protein